ncbi:MAG: PilZ domain-containing protein [Proteobacteria bacterium]|nr:PilZ domain-containing protein [Pseudomonadota bacterium]
MEGALDVKHKGQLDQRNYKRKALDNCHMTYKVKGDNENRKGIVKNLSDEGLLVMSENRFHEGDKLTLIVEPKNTLVAPLEAQVEVIWVEELDSDCYRAGVSIKETD